MIAFLKGTRCLRCLLFNVSPPCSWDRANQILISQKAMLGTMEIEEVAKALSSDTRLRILRLLAEGEASAISVFKKYNERFSDRRERVTIYRELEVLYRSDFLVKTYKEDSKEIVYRLAARSINIDLITQTVSAGP